MSTLRELADKYRQMPNGGARLTVGKPVGERFWRIGDGLVIKATFPTRNQAIFALQRAGFKEIERGVFKLRPSNEEVIESQACRIRDLISQNQELLKACKSALAFLTNNGALNGPGPITDAVKAAIARAEGRS